MAYLLFHSSARLRSRFAYSSRLKLRIHCHSYLFCAHVQIVATGRLFLSDRKSDLKEILQAIVDDLTAVRLLFLLDLSFYILIALDSTTRYLIDESGNHNYEVA